MNLPNTLMYLDEVLGNVDLVGGLVSAVDGLDVLEGLPIASCFVPRFIFMDHVSTLKELNLYPKTWRQQMFKSF